MTDEQLHFSVPGTYGELGATLAHLAAGEAGYVWRFDQDPDRFQWDEDDPVPPVERLAIVLDQTGARFVELAATTPDDLVVSYIIEGKERSWPAWVILGQVSRSRARASITCGDRSRPSSGLNHLTSTCGLTRWRYRRARLISEVTARGRGRGVGSGAN